MPVKIKEINDDKNPNTNYQATPAAAPGLTKDNKEIARASRGE